MKTILRTIGYNVLLLFVLFSLHSEAFGQTSASNQDQLIQRIQYRYGQIDLLRASFTQHTTSPFNEAMPLNEGTLTLRDNHYRVETDVQTFVTNGETTWIYNTFQNQVLINDFVEDESTFIINDFLNNFEQEYEVLETKVVHTNGIKYNIVRLESLNGSSFFKSVTLSVRDSDDIITRIEVLDVNDALLDFRLEEIEINPIIEEDPFTFLPPEGAEVIDLRS